MACVFNQNRICQRLNLPTEKKCRCPLYKTSYEVCAVCGQPILEGGVMEEDKVFCNNCGHQLGKCATCVNSAQCAFETDPSPVPKVIQRTVRQGNMASTFPARNPSRVEITCKKGCCCFDEEKGCMREFSFCDRWKLQFAAARWVAQNVSPK